VSLEIRIGQKGARVSVTPFGFSGKCGESPGLKKPGPIDLGI